MRQSEGKESEGKVDGAGRGGRMGGVVEDMQQQMEEEINKRNQEKIKRLGLGGKDEVPDAQLELPQDGGGPINIESDQQAQVEKAVMELDDDREAFLGGVSEVSFGGQH